MSLSLRLHLRMMHKIERGAKVIFFLAPMTLVGASLSEGQLEGLARFDTLGSVWTAVKSSQSVSLFRHAYLWPDKRTRTRVRTRQVGGRY